MQTRYAIRREAFRLFKQNGYANTTIDEIADAAEVSPRTFYRYFGVKEAVLISDDHISPIVAAFVAAPRELTLVAAYRHAVAKVFGALSQGRRGGANTNQQMMYGIPEARGLLYTEYVRLIGLIAQAIEARLEEPTDEVEWRALAGAIVGVLIAASHNNPFPEDALLQSLSILDARLR